MKDISDTKYLEGKITKIYFNKVLSADECRNLFVSCPIPDDGEWHEVMFGDGVYVDGIKVWKYEDLR